jgi:branched-chain amino acid transport system ATP-binding protein
VKRTSAILALSALALTACGSGGSPGSTGSSESGGEQQPVAIGRMMTSDPALMLLDEPSLGLVEQRVDLALDVCNRLYVMSGGAVVRENRCQDVDPAGRALIDAYLG